MSTKQTGPEAEDSIPAEKSVSGPPEDKALKRGGAKCPDCGGPLTPYGGDNSFKAGTAFCDACGQRVRTE